MNARIYWLSDPNYGLLPSSETICRTQCTPKHFSDWQRDLPADEEFSIPQHSLSASETKDDADADEVDIMLQYHPHPMHDDQNLAFQYKLPSLFSNRRIGSFYGVPEISPALQICSRSHSDSEPFNSHTEINLALSAPLSPVSCDGTHWNNTLATPASLSSYLDISPITLKHVQDPCQTPFGKHYESSTDWMTSEPYISPVLRTTVVQSPSPSKPKDVNTLPTAIGVTGSPFTAATNKASFMETLLSAISPASSFSHNLSSIRDEIDVPERRVTSPLFQSSSSPSEVLKSSSTDTNNLNSLSMSPTRRNLMQTFTPRQCFGTPAAPQNSFLSPLTPLPPSPLAVLPSVTARNGSLHAAQSKNSRKREISVSLSPTPMPRLKRICHNTRGLQHRRLAEGADHNSSPKIDPLPEVRPCVASVSDNCACSPRHPSRTFPLDGTVEISSTFSLLYRRFPASSYFLDGCSESPCSLFKMPHPGGIYNSPRDVLDLYTPRFVKGKGKEKMGLCPICIENVERGGEDKKVWLAMKFSAFKCYHMQYGHGISAVSARPFSPPIAFRLVPRPSPGKKEKSFIREGMCHKCRKWIVVEGIKDMEVKVKEIFWWKHAASCHQGSTIEGERDIYVEDDVYHRLMQLS